MKKKIDWQSFEIQDGRRHRIYDAEIGPKFDMTYGFLDNWN